MKKKIFNKILIFLFTILIFSYFMINKNFIYDEILIIKHRLTSDKFEINKLPNSFNLKISSKNRSILEKCRQKALHDGVLLDNNQPYVKAKLVTNSNSYRVKVKLKGTLMGHWKSPIRWSYRIVIQDSICKENGLKVFSIQSAHQRGGVIDIFYHHILKYFGLISLKTDFVNFAVNDVILDYYSMEEFFDYQLLKRNNRPIGPILKFEFEDYWRSIDWNNSENINSIIINKNYNEVYKNTYSKCYKLKSIKFKELEKYCNCAKQMLDSFIKGKQSARKIFDLDLFGKYFAINTLFGNQHPSYLTNLRFYYNPKTKLIEPIGYDMERIRYLKDAVNSDPHWENFWPNKVTNPQFISQLFSDSLMNTSYINALKSLKNFNIGELSNEFKAEITRSKHWDYETPDYTDILKANLIEINSVL